MSDQYYKYINNTSTLCLTCMKELKGIKFSNIKRHCKVLHNIHVENQYSKRSKKNFLLGIPVNLSRAIKCDIPDRFFEAENNNDYSGNSGDNVLNNANESEITAQPLVSNEDSFKRPSDEINKSIEEGAQSENKVQYLSGNDDNFKKVAEVWSTKLTQMDTFQQLCAEKFINDIIFEGLLGNLNKDSLKINS